MINKLKLHTPNLGPIETWRVESNEWFVYSRPSKRLGLRTRMPNSQYRDHLAPATLDLLLHSMDVVLERWKEMVGTDINGNSITAALKTTG